MSGIYFVGAFRRRSGMSLDAFTLHFETTHRAFITPFARSGELVGYVQNIRTDPNGIVSDIDGAAELWIRDSDALAAMMADPGFKAAAEVDSPLFIDMPPRGGLARLDVPHAAADRAALGGATKLMLFFDACEGEAADAAWRTSAPVLMPTATPLRIERARALPAEDGTVPLFGCESSWWRSEEALVAAWSDRIDGDGAAALGFACVSILVATEAVAVDPPA